MGTTGTIIAIIVTAVLTWIGHAVLTGQQRRLEVAKALEANRRELYQRIMGLFFDVLKDAKAKSINIDLMDVKMIEIARDLSVYASDEVLLKFLELRRIGEQEKPKDPLILLKLWGELIISMRKDLGHEATQIQPMQIAELVVTDLRQHLEKQKNTAQ